MRRTLPFIIVLTTALLVLVGWWQAGGAELRSQRSASTPEQAVRGLMAQVQARNWNKAYASLDHGNGVEQSDFVREIAGTDGSLRTYSSLQSYDVWPLRADANHANLRVRMNWSSAVGSLDEVRDLQVVHDGSAWHVVWPKPNFTQVALQVLLVIYLRWDVIGGR